MILICPTISEIRQIASYISKCLAYIALKGISKDTEINWDYNCRDPKWPYPLALWYFEHFSITISKHLLRC